MGATMRLRPTESDRSMRLAGEQDPPPPHEEGGEACTFTRLIVDVTCRYCGGRLVMTNPGYHDTQVSFIVAKCTRRHCRKEGVLRLAYEPLPSQEAEERRSQRMAAQARVVAGITS